MSKGQQNAVAVVVFLVLMLGGAPILSWLEAPLFINFIWGMGLGFALTLAWEK